MKIAVGALAVVALLAGGTIARAEQPTSTTMKQDARRTTNTTKAKTKRAAHKSKSKTKSVGKRTADGFGKGVENAGDMIHRGGKELRDKGK